MERWARQWEHFKAGLISRGYTKVTRDGAYKTLNDEFIGTLRYKVRYDTKNVVLNSSMGLISRRLENTIDEVECKMYERPAKLSSARWDPYFNTFEWGEERMPRVYIALPDDWPWILEATLDALDRQSKELFIHTSVEASWPQLIGQIHGSRKPFVIPTALLLFGRKDEAFEYIEREIVPGNLKMNVVTNFICTLLPHFGYTLPDEWRCLADSQIIDLKNVIVKRIDV